MRIFDPMDVGSHRQWGEFGENYVKPQFPAKFQVARCQPGA